MIFDQHSPAFGQLSRAVRFEIGTKLRADVVRAGRTQFFAHAIRGGARDLRIRRIVTDGIHQTIEVLVAHVMPSASFAEFFARDAASPPL